MSFFEIVLAGILILGPLIAIHEFGHFWVARRCGVKVLTFSIGFGPAIWRRVARDGTEYRIAAIPLGGYVRMLDEREGEVAIEVCIRGMTWCQDAPGIILDDAVMVPRRRQLAGQGHRQSVGFYQCAVACQSGGLQKATFLKNGHRARKMYLLVGWHETRFLGVNFCWRGEPP